ncbi:MAG: hypothetical protein PQ612_07460 [Rickettsiales bacterium]|nr:hypothetical protein [Pseudomonadota bacterium]MDA0966924.1 hypothetical protein [Pseudomonadota bacterium]MDG4543843.1 hypothetical protein [Rickettsiales bacterium]MDG4545989.1 hypothetical protein [Rickettsiales bacterium]MDG4548235.1 hypothetical protein [Rickettsiales bacterium]
MNYNNFEIETEYNKILISPQDLIFYNITRGIYDFNRSILHAAAIERNNRLLQQIIELLPQWDRTDALESTDTLGKSTISYSASDPESLKIALSQYKKSNKPLHILCYINGEKEQQNLGVAIAKLEHAQIEANLLIGLALFNTCMGIDAQDRFNNIFPKHTVNAYKETKKLLH